MRPRRIKPTRKRTTEILFDYTRRRDEIRAARAHNASREVADRVFRAFAVALERALAGSRPGIVVSPRVTPPSRSRPVSIALG